VVSARAAECSGLGGIGMAGVSSSGFSSIRAFSFAIIGKGSIVPPFMERNS